MIIRVASVIVIVKVVHTLVYLLNTLSARTAYAIELVKLSLIFLFVVVLRLIIVCVVLLSVFISHLTAPPFIFTIPIL